MTWRTFVALWGVGAVGSAVVLTRSAGASLTLLVLAVFLGGCVAVLGALLATAARAALTPAPAVHLEDPDEIVLGAVPATHWLGFEARSGRLFLTNRALRFVPQRFSFQRDPVEVRLGEVIGVDASTALELHLDRGGRVTFVAPNADGLARVAADVRSGGAAQRPWVPVAPTRDLRV
jgi:hypothetical protein